MTRDISTAAARNPLPGKGPDAIEQAFAKVPQVTLVFWLIKIAATTLGETGGDAVTMSWLGETTANAKHARQEPHDGAQPQKDKDVHRNLGDGKVKLHVCLKGKRLFHSALRGFEG